MLRRLTGKDYLPNHYEGHVVKCPPYILILQNQGLFSAKQYYLMSKDKKKEAIKCDAKLPGLSSLSFARFRRAPC